ncbi:hypothetical protein DP117_24155 [Brasilonema sp. UFV-L1]|uniref:hypothetical protein n=1 Tax=Brasilonema sp. UFV-L1 TaxID=2234130 RepID=UPI0016B0F6E1|nr:hypothetical protein [Brasilonema sp. UFV-L1]
MITELREVFSFFLNSPSDLLLNSLSKLIFYLFGGTAGAEIKLPCKQGQKACDVNFLNLLQPYLQDLLYLWLAYE